MSQDSTNQPTREWPDSLPTITYILEKMSNSLIALHTLWQEIHRYVPEDIPTPERGLSVKQDMLQSEVFAAFSYEVIALRALVNKQDRNGQPNAKELLALPDAEFQEWLNSL